MAGWKDKFEKLQARGKNLKSKAEAGTEAAIGVLESVGTGFGLGLFKAKRLADGKKNEIFGVPTPLAAGGLALAAGLTMKKRQRDALNIANASFACWGFDKGEAYEEKRLAEKDKKGDTGAVRRQLGASNSHVAMAQERARKQRERMRQQAR